MEPDRVRAFQQGKIGEDAPTRQRRQRERRERLDAEQEERQIRQAERLAVDEREQRFERGRAAAQPTPFVPAEDKPDKCVRPLVAPAVCGILTRS